MFIENFYVYHYKKIEEAKFEFAPITVFVGANNSGKSSILSALHFFYSTWTSLELLKTDKTPFISIQQIRKNSRQKSKIVLKDKDVSLKFSGSFTDDELLYLPTENFKDIAYSKVGYKFNTKRDKDHNIAFIANYSSEDPKGMKISLTNKQSFSLDLTHRNLHNKRSENLKHTPDFYSIYSPGLSGIPFKEEYRGNRIVREEAVNFGTAGNVLRNILLQIWSEQTIREEFLEDFYRIFEDERDKTIHKIHVIDEPNSNTHIQCDIEISYKDNGEVIKKKIPLNQMGVGFLQVLQIVAYKHLYKPKVMLLDEPEIHLHSKLIVKLLELFEVWASQENPTQLFISTHSRTVLKYLEDYTHKNQGQKLYKLVKMIDGTPIEIDEINADAIDEILIKELGEIDTTKVLLLTEDKNQLIKKALDDNVIVDSVDGTKFIPIVKIYKSKFPNVKILCHVDLDQEKVVREKLTKYDDSIPIWATDYATLEAYWLEYDNLVKFITHNIEEELDIETFDALICDEWLVTKAHTHFGGDGRYCKDTFKELGNVLEYITQKINKASTPEERLQKILEFGKEWKTVKGIGQVYKKIPNIILTEYTDRKGIQPKKSSEESDKYPNIEIISLNEAIQKLQDTQIK